ncbi:MAG: hypothetical protein LBH43_17995 [Treponema sp.]|jgi:hypothetical protein|nr:hypothetical protein [Treponema sp.]
MVGLRSLAEKDLRHALEGEFSTPVILISTAGERIDKTVDGRLLAGRVLWSHKEINPETGEPVIVPTPVVTLRESSLPETPKTGEVWGVIIPESPRIDAPLKQYVTDAAGVVENVRNLGYINLFLVDVEDKEAK